jgi:hypothetical protein
MVRMIRWRKKRRPYPSPKGEEDSSERLGHDRHFDHVVMHHSAKLSPHNIGNTLWVVLGQKIALAC